MLKKMGIATLSLWLSGCSLTTIAPAEQLQKSIVKPNEVQVATKGRAVIKKQPVSEYRCDQGKVVRVRFASTKKNSTISVIFNQTTHKLSPTVSSKGKKYSNIRWIWFEDFNGKGTLKDNRQNILAKNCIKQ